MIALIQFIITFRISIWKIPSFRKHKFSSFFHDSIDVGEEGGREKFLEEDIEKKGKSVVGYYGYSLWNIKQYHFPFAISTGGR